MLLGPSRHLPRLPHQVHRPPHLLQVLHPGQVTHSDHLHLQHLGEPAPRPRPQVLLQGGLPASSHGVVEQDVPSHLAHFRLAASERAQNGTIGFLIGTHKTGRLVGWHPAPKSGLRLKISQILAQ